MARLCIFIGILIIVLSLLAVYSGSNLIRSLQPDGSLIENLIAGIFTMIIEVVAISVIISHLADRRWRPTRQTIQNRLASDYSYMLMALDGAILAAQSTETADLQMVWRDLIRHARENVVATELLYLTPAYTPEIASEVVTYMKSRQKIAYSSTFVGDSDADQCRELLAGRMTGFYSDDGWRSYCVAKLLLLMLLHIKEQKHVFPTHGLIHIDKFRSDWREVFELLRSRVEEVEQGEQ